jgi:hypothetical protein
MMSSTTTTDGICGIASPTGVHSNTNTNTNDSSSSTSRDLPGRVKVVGRCRGGVEDAMLLQQRLKVRLAERKTAGISGADQVRMLLPSTARAHI